MVQLHSAGNPVKVRFPSLQTGVPPVVCKEVVHGHPRSRSEHEPEGPPMSARMASRPRQVTVWYRGIPYTLDLVSCRRALVARQVEGLVASMESLARAVGISRSTASRFFSGRPTSL